MAIYVSRDIKAEDDGDITIENGGLVEATVLESVRHYLLTWVLTTRGAFTFDPTVGWGAESYLGRNNTPPVRNIMERDLGYSFSQAEDLVLSDLNYKVTALDQTTALVVANLSGTIVEADGSSPDQDLVMAFSFPFDDGQITVESDTTDEVDQ